MTDETALSKLDDLPVNSELAELSGEMFDSDEDVSRLPNLEARVKIIKILNDSQLFDVNDEKHEQIIGVIVELQQTKTWFERSFDLSGGGEKPLCFSNNGIFPHSDSVQPQAEKCAGCPKNKFYDDPDPKKKGKKKKDCRDTITMYLYNPKEDLPLLLRASTMNRKPVIEYIKAIAEKKLAKEMVITKFTLVKDNESADMEFSGLRLEAVDTIKALIKFFKETTKEELSVKQIAQRIKQFKDEHADTFKSSDSAVSEAVADAPKSDPTESTSADPTPQKAEEPIEVNLDEPAISADMAEEPPF